ncbi:MAG: Glutamate-1-semialdehyde 2,1-aminomutase [bacterium ADurb.Bin236]|nr:MAG: Glutamate-1-semialdehyde 2,1-aminomutase [bacterium ADurb.Bin236]
MSRSADLFAEALKYIPGGVNSPVRAFGSVGGGPRFMESGKGARIIDADGKEYIDCVASWGPLILGHSRPEVVAAVKSAAERGASFGAPTSAETRLAKLIVDMVPSLDKVRLVNSGTEATMSAVRLARAATRRDKIIKFEGCYHGHADSFLIKAGSGALTLGQPSSPGVPASLAADTLNADYNNIDSVKKLFDALPGQIACVILEPVAANVGVILPEPGFLEDLRQLTAERGALLIFDEVITGFRLAPGGAQEYFNISPDLTTLGKIIGGGLPVGAYGGRSDLMDMMAPSGPVYQAGTLSGNPIAVAAGITTLEILLNESPYQRMAALADRLFEGLEKGARENGVDVAVNKIASMGCAFFAPGPVRNYAEALKSDIKLFARFHSQMLERGVYLAPSQFEACFVGAAHTEADVDAITAAAADSLKAIKSGR